MLYEQGSRIINAVRYGSGFGTNRVVLPDDFVVSNVDLAPTIFDLVNATVPTEYMMDGISWLDEVQSAINGDDTTPETPCCELRYIDVKQSRSIVTADYQYIWRANDDVETLGDVADLYENTHDEQQLYDLNADPDQQINLITDYESYREDDSNGSLSSTITTFQSLMRDYVDETCPLATGDGECVKPSYTFCTEILSATVRASSLEDAESKFVSNYPNCSFSEYYYWIGVNGRSRIKMEVCCADDEEDGAVFPGDYTAPSGYSLYVIVTENEDTDIVFESTDIDTETDTDIDTVLSEEVLKLADDGDSVQNEDENSVPILILNTAHKLMISGVMFIILVIGCIGGRLWNEFSKPKIGGIRMMKLEGIPSEDESDISILEKEEKQ